MHLFNKNNPSECCFFGFDFPSGDGSLPLAAISFFYFYFFFAPALLVFFSLSEYEQRKSLTLPKTTRAKPPTPKRTSISSLCVYAPCLSPSQHIQRAPKFEREAERQPERLSLASRHFQRPPKNRAGRRGGVAFFGRRLPVFVLVDFNSLPKFQLFPSVMWRFCFGDADTHRAKRVAERERQRRGGGERERLSESERGRERERTSVVIDPTLAAFCAVPPQPISFHCR